MKDACEKAGYNFPFVEILKWYKNRPPLSDKQLDEILHSIYYLTFPGPRALCERLPKGSASLERIRNWINNQLIGEMHCKPPRQEYARFTEQ